MRSLRDETETRIFFAAAMNKAMNKVHPADFVSQAALLVAKMS